MSGYLQLSDGSFLGVRDGLVIGRVVGCDVVIDDKKASRRHARLIVEGGVVEVEDLQSSNGTLLNGAPVTRRMLRDGDEIRIGKTAIVYKEGHVPGMANAHGAPAAAPAGKAADLLGGDDLFGGDDLEGDDAGSTAAASSAAPPPPAPPKPIAPPPPIAPPKPIAPPPPVAAPAPAPAPARDVVEFEDEVVEVRRAPPKEEPVAQRSKPAAAAGPGDVVAGSQRILQFSKQAGGNNVLGDDMAQMGGGMRALIVLGVLALGAGIVYGIITLMQ